MRTEMHGTQRPATSVREAQQRNAHDAGTQIEAEQRRGLLRHDVTFDMHRWQSPPQVPWRRSQASRVHMPWWAAAHCLRAKPRADAPEGRRPTVLLFVPSAVLHADVDMHAAAISTRAEARTTQLQARSQQTCKCIAAKLCC